MYRAYIIKLGSYIVNSSKMLSHEKEKKERFIQGKVYLKTSVKSTTILSYFCFLIIRYF